MRMAARNATLGEIQYALKNLPDQTAFRMQKPGITAAAKVVLVEARNRAPVRSGKLRNSLRVENKTIPWRNYGERIRFAKSMVVSGKGQTIHDKAARASFQPIVGTGRTGAKTDVYWAHFLERGTKHGKFSNSRFVKRYKKRPPVVGSWRIKPRLFIEKSVRATAQKQEAAFVQGCARGLVNLAKPIEVGKSFESGYPRAFPNPENLKESSKMALKNAMAIVKIEDALVEYSKDGAATWYEVPNVSSISIAVSERVTQTTASLRTLVATTVKPTDIGDITIPFAAYLPQLAMSQDLDASWKNGTKYQYRITTKEETIYSGKAGVTAAIDTDGVVTLAPAPPNHTGADFADNDTIAPGNALKMGTNLYIIDSIDLDNSGALNELKVRPGPDSDVAAAQYAVVLPALQLKFTAEVKKYGEATGEREGAYTTELILTPNTHVTASDWRPIIPV